jgi:hypothetical protein
MVNMVERMIIKVDVKSDIRPIKRISERIVDISILVENIPWYWVGLFTSLVLLVLSAFMEEVSPRNINLFYGAEYGAVGAALAQGRGFSDPFSTGSGATAWVSPLLPAILGGIFYITGLDIIGTYWILHSIKIFSLGFGTSLIWAVLQKKNHGFALVFYFWMGILFYIYRLELFSLYHDEWLIFLVISLAFWAWHEQAAFRGHIALVAAFSAAALSNPILWVALFIVMVIFNKAYEYKGESGKSSFKKQETYFARNSFWIAVSVSFLLILGWTVRNWIQLEIFAPIKSNAGYEIFQAQVASRTGVPDYSTFAKHPINFASKEHQSYAALGEANFIRTYNNMAIRSILSEPTDYYRRVVTRFSNAFMFTVLPYNVSLVDPRMCFSDLERLRSAGFIAYRNNQKIWIDLDDLDRDLIKSLPSLGLTDPLLAMDNWRSMVGGHNWYRFSWERIIGGSLIGGVPWVALFIAILIQRRSGLAPFVWWASLLLLFYLIPYVLISHYLRYQLPLLGMQAILLTAGTVALLRALRPGKISAHHKE